MGLYPVELAVGPNALTAVPQLILSLASPLHSGIEQLEARLAHNQEVTGSSPVPATSFM